MRLRPPALDQGVASAYGPGLRICAWTPRRSRIASTLQRMLLDIADVGADLTFLPGAVAGMTVLIGDMTISGS